MNKGNKPTAEDLSLDCRDLAKNPALTERNRRMLADVADRLMALEHERDFARFREDSARNVMRKFRRELECAEAERDAAVKDMKLMADKAREEHGDDVPCFACRFDGDRSIMPSGDFAEECPGFDKENCFEWRGAQGEG